MQQPILFLERTDEEDWFHACLTWEDGNMDESAVLDSRGLPVDRIGEGRVPVLVLPKKLFLGTVSPSN